GQGVSEVVHVDHCASYAGLRQAIERVIDQRLARHFHQRLGPIVGERAHPRTKACCKHHGGIGRQRGHCSSPPPVSRISRGTFTVNHSATGASAGCLRSRSSACHTRGIIAR